MFENKKTCVFLLIMCVIILVNCSSGGSSSSGNNDTGSSGISGYFADHTAVAGFDRIPEDTRIAVRDLNIAYWHTSHGSQLVSGVSHLDSSYSLPNLNDNGGPDLGTSTWNTITSSYLDAHTDTDVVIWSWCGQASTSIDMNTHYLSKMAALEASYPDVTFIYMTGHLRSAEYPYDFTTNQRLQGNNTDIRTFCSDHNLWLFDFADIESYLDGSDVQCMYDGMPVECLWPADPTWSCAHSRAPNCLRKGKAFWWILARITGWEDD